MTHMATHMAAHSRLHRRLGIDLRLGVASGHKGPPDVPGTGEGLIGGGGLKWMGLRGNMQEKVLFYRCLSSLHSGNLM